MSIQFIVLFLRGVIRVRVFQIFSYVDMGQGSMPVFERQIRILFLSSYLCLRRVLLSHSVYESPMTHVAALV